jgi:tetratricopeptide (TPR) repeat protein
VAAGCRRHQANRDWSALAQCTVQLRPLDARLAAELSTLAAEEARSAPHVALAREALRDRALKRAKAEIDQVWPGSVDCADLQRAYAAAETQQIDALASQLNSVKDASCAAYNQLLARYRASDPPRVTQEAARRVPCKAPPKCDADALEAQARALFNKNKYEDALDAYDQAYACRPDPALLRDAFVVACNMRHKFEARSYWRQLSPAARAQSLTVCVSHGITQAMLNAP